MYTDRKSALLSILVFIFNNISRLGYVKNQAAPD